MANEQDRKEKNFGLEPEAWNEVVSTLKKGNPKPLAQTLLKRYDKFKRILWKEFGQDEIIADAVLDGIKNVSEFLRKASPERLPKYGQLESYVAKACRNAYITLIREPTISINSSGEDSDKMDEFEELLSVTDILKIRKTIDFLDEDQQKLVQLRFFEHNSWQNVGKALGGISGDAAKHRWRMTILREMKASWELLLKQFLKELSIIDAYAALQKWAITRSKSGLSYLIEQIGHGDHATIGNKICMNAESRFTSNVILEAEQEQELILGNSENLAGLEEGLAYFKENSKGVLLIPSLLGYGAHPLNKDKTNISNNGVLIYKILVKKITPNAAVKTN
jgi:DNA-directed RNA polymerase specialized sigma24 family protein